MKGLNRFYTQPKALKTFYVFLQKVLVTIFAQVIIQKK